MKKLTVLLLAGLIAVAGCSSAQPAPVAATLPATADPINLPVDVDVQTVESLRANPNVLVLDVREDTEYAGGHIPGAVLLPLGQIPNRLNDIPKDKTVIAVCRSGHRSSQATQLLRQQGFDNIHNMLGGMNAWSQAGFEIQK